MQINKVNYKVIGKISYKEYRKLRAENYGRCLGLLECLLKAKRTKGNDNGFPSKIKIETHSFCIDSIKEVLNDRIKIDNMEVDYS